MRARSVNNFTIEDLKKISEICKENNVKTFLALNTIIYDHDINLMKNICNAAKINNIDAVIVSDVSVMEYAKSIGLSVHCSTQLNISNIGAVKFFSKFTDTIVLARELTINQITNICDEIKKQEIKGPKNELIKIEIFIHGALCVAISGKCYMSLALHNASANRGACLQNCRRSYKVIDEETGDELLLDNKYVMSPKDLCTIGFIDRIIESGVSILKIEGRGKPAEYVYTVTKTYKEAIESYFNKDYTKEKIEKWINELEEVYNRGFWHGGYYLGKQLGEWSGSYGSKATKEKVFLGIANKYYDKVNIGEFTIQSGILKVGDEIIITGPTTGIVQTKITNIRSNDTDVEYAKKGDIITVPIDNKIRSNDKLYLFKDKI